MFLVKIIAPCATHSRCSRYSLYQCSWFRWYVSSWTTMATISESSVRLCTFPIHKCSYNWLEERTIIILIGSAGLFHSSGLQITDFGINLAWTPQPKHVSVSNSRHFHISCVADRELKLMSHFNSLLTRDERQKL